MTSILPTGYLIDFRDPATATSTVPCAVCGHTASGWDRQGGFVFHESTVPYVPPCQVRTEFR